MEKLKHILVISRMSQYCKEAVQTGISLAKRYGADVTVLHLISNPVDMEALNAPLPYRDDRHKTYASIQDEAKDQLDRILRSELESGFPVRLIIRDGKPADEVARVVEEGGIDLVVLMAHEEGRLEHMFFNQDNAEIIRRLPCSTLLVKREPDTIKW